jgi:exonuclease III
MNNANRSYQMMSWNVRGFNNPSRQEEVKQVVSTFKPDVICLQETKLSEISNSNVRNILGP